MNAIETHGLSKQFGRRTAVDDLTISVPAGSIAGFIGPNGAGKTTTVGLLLGLVRANAGSATVLGAPLTEPGRYLPRVGALLEAPTFYPSLSGWTNLEVIARLAGYPRSRVGEVIEIVELSDRARDRVGTYSLGMKQRLGVAMALLPDPDLLILDEPANGLDPLGIVGVRDLLRGLRDEGKTILLSSHLLGELERLTTWLVMLHEGKALFCGAAKDLLTQRVELVIDAEDGVQRELATRIASAEGYAVTEEDRALHVVCRPDFAETLGRHAKAEGVTDLAVHVKEASLEQLFLALVKADRP
jgi:ABC-2 type transport system ATP-binding protein